MIPRELSVFYYLAVLALITEDDSKRNEAHLIQSRVIRIHEALRIKS